MWRKGRHPNVNGCDGCGRFTPGGRARIAPAVRRGRLQAPWHSSSRSMAVPP
ncbi:hypothetical protein A176_003459 [Myxococcus hansupus]|uniref:Uncharacterized protein n=1 Tax=Pseudomyxococcus hansupus TaxID=1297742 RepID=A0A0H4XEK8_9BACT|nr:hypothetical protein A176_003459 [Myxococcus hansupus]